jgi:hypothetical protein
LLLIGTEGGRQGEADLADSEIFYYQQVTHTNLSGRINVIFGPQVRELINSFFSWGASLLSAAHFLMANPRKNPDPVNSG